MKKTLLSLAILMVCASTANAASALLSPTLTSPLNNDAVGVKQPVKFSWVAKNPSTIKQYHLIISNNERFVDYSLSKGKCTNAKTCADFVVKDSSKPLPATHPFLQKEGTYFWQVQSTDKSGNSSFVFQGQKNSTAGSDERRKKVNVNQFRVVQKDISIDDITVMPKEAANGSEFTFTAMLNDELPLGQSVKIKIGDNDNWNEMDGDGLNYSFTLPSFTVAKSIKDQDISYTIAVFDENNEQQKYLDGYFTILANAAEPEKENTPPTLSFVSGADSIGKNKSYSLKLKANDDDGNLSRIEVNWGDGSANDSKAATNGATLSFSHTYKFAGIQNLVATAFDDVEAASDDFTKSVTVKDTAVPPPVVTIPRVSNANASPSSITQGNSTTFSATLSATLPSGYTVKINYGNGLIKMNGSGTSFSLSASPSSLGSSLFTVGIYDSKNTLKSNQIQGNFSVVEPAPVVIVPPEPVATIGDVETFVSGSKTFSYTKIANDGSELPKTAKLGTAPKDWACTKDNNTGLIWEVKTDDGGLRDMNNSYTWYEPDASKNGGDAGVQNGGSCKGGDCDTYAYPPAVNKQGLCGASDWRMPTVQELSGLLVCSDGKYTIYGDEYATQYGENSRGAIDCTNWGNVTHPTINTSYFPNTQDAWFWSSSPHADVSNYAWVVGFSNGYSRNDFKYNFSYVRLVR